MKKLLNLITGGLIKDIGGVIDNLTTTDEERLQAKQKIQELLEEADKDAQQQVTERWKFDMQSDSFLSKNIRPLTLVFGIYRWKHWRVQHTERIYPYFSNITHYSLWCVFCWKNLGKKQKEWQRR
jgi:hypothetical protein